MPVGAEMSLDGAEIVYPSATLWLQERRNNFGDVITSSTLRCLLQASVSERMSHSHEPCYRSRE